MLGHRTAETLAAWLAVRGRRAPGCLFVPLGAGHLIEGERLTSRMVSQVLEKRAREAALPPS